MTERLSIVRQIKETVRAPRPVKECGDGKSTAKKIRKKKRVSVKAIREEKAFDRWMKSVALAIEDITGMDMDILPEVPWRQYFDAGLRPRKAAENALAKAEAEDGLDYGEPLDEGMDDDDYRSLEESVPALRKPGLRKRALGGKPLSEGQRAQAISRLSSLLDVFGQEEEDEEEDEEEEEEREPLPPESPVRPVGVPYGNDMVARAASAVQEDLRLTEERSIVPQDPRGSSGLSSVGSTPSRGPIGKMPMNTTESEDIARAAAAVQGDLMQSGGMTTHTLKPTLGSPFPVPPKEVKTEKKEVAEEPEKKSERVDEAEVQGGDYGRWKPATAAAGKHGVSLAVAISKATDEKYTFFKEGMPQSAEGGSELWFAIEPRDSKKPLYFLGIKYIKGKDKEAEPKWSVLLRKGMGLGSASSVAFIKNVETSKLGSAVGSLKQKVGG